MEIKNNTNSTKVRYGVHYNDRNYEYALHSGKGRFLRNLADVVNVIEYCIVQDLKNALYNPNEMKYNIDVMRYVNDKIDENWNTDRMKSSVANLVDQIVLDNIQRNS